MTYEELMMQSLSALLENDESLYCPIYGTLIQDKIHYFGFFALTDHCLLNALLNGSRKEIAWSIRVPLDVKEVNIKKCLFPGQHIITINFNEGEPCKIRVSEKVYGIKNQAANLAAFIHFIRQWER